MEAKPLEMCGSLGNWRQVVENSKSEAKSAQRDPLVRTNEVNVVGAVTCLQNVEQ